MYMLGLAESFIQFTMNLVCAFVGLAFVAFVINAFRTR